MSYQIRKLTYSEGRAYRYQVTDETGEVRYVAEPTGAFLPDPSRLITLFDADYQPIGRVEPSPFSSWWWTREYSLLLGDQPIAKIEECWTLVDRILLRLPSYIIQIGDHTYIAHGNRYGEQFYELFLPLSREEELPDELAAEGTAEELAAQKRLGRGEKVGEIRHLAADYVVEVKAALLRQTPLIVAAFTILADIHLYEQWYGWAIHPKSGGKHT